MIFNDNNRHLFAIQMLWNWRNELIFFFNFRLEKLFILRPKTLLFWPPACIFHTPNYHNFSPVSSNKTIVWGLSRPWEGLVCTMYYSCYIIPKLKFSLTSQEAASWSKLEAIKVLMFIKNLRSKIHYLGMKKFTNYLVFQSLMICIRIFFSQQSYKRLYQIFFEWH